METVNLLSTLFMGTRKMKIVPDLAVQRRGPKGLYCSKYNTSQAAKISYAALALEYILTGRVVALELQQNNGIYVELWDEDKTEITDRVMYCNGSVCSWANDVPKNSSHLVLPFIIYALAESSEMEETQIAFDACVAEYKMGALSEGAVFLFCDCFYYEWKANNYAANINCDNTLNLDLIRQAVRTKNARILSSFAKNSIQTPKLDVVEIGEETEEVKAAYADKFDACLRGVYNLSYCWEQHQRVYIPHKSKLENYSPNESFFTMVDLISSELLKVQQRLDDGAYGIEAIDNNYVNIILCGKPGTGKTTLANALGATFGMPVRTVTVSKHSEEDVFQGMTKVVEGGFQFVETPFLDVYKNGGLILIEEFNLMDPAVLMGALGQAIEKPFIIYEDGYKEVRRHPMCVIVATMNTGTQGSREPSEAFTSRLPYTFILDDPTEAQFIDILVKNGYEKDNCVKVYNAYSRIVDTLKDPAHNAEDVAMSVTLRHCLGALGLMKIGVPFKRALKQTMCGVIAIKDVALAEAIYDGVVEPLRD